MYAQSREQRPLCRAICRRVALNAQSQAIGRTVNCQGENQGGSDFAEMSRRISVKMAGRASRTNVMDMFADEKEQYVSGNQCQQDGPPRATPQTLGQNR